MDIIEKYLDAWTQGKVCLHPTDSIPGLSFNPLLSFAKKAMIEMKGRAPEKGFVCLVGNFGQALKYWKPLPIGWERILSAVWPAPVSFIWQGTETVTDCIKAVDGSLALRVPDLNEQDIWFSEVLDRVHQPLPTTSVNKSENQPFTDWPNASRWVSSQRQSSFVPPLSYQPQSTNLPSTVIKIEGPKEYTVLRAGRWPVENLTNLLEI